MVNSYPSSSISTPTSPQDGNETSMVSSVYSQGTTPSQSPVGASGGNASGSSSMPTTKRKRSVNPQGDENFLRALEAVRFGGIGFCKAARLYGVNNRTLWLEYKKRGYPISRPSIKNRIKLEPNLSPPPSTTGDDNSLEHYDATLSPAINMTLQQEQQEQQGNNGSNSAVATTSSTPLMCPPPHAHPMNVMGFLDTRHTDFTTTVAGIHQMSRQRYPDGQTVNMNTGAVNLQGLNFNSM